MGEDLKKAEDNFDNERKLAQYYKKQYQAKVASGDAAGAAKDKAEYEKRAGNLGKLKAAFEKFAKEKAGQDADDYEAAERKKREDADAAAKGQKDAKEKGLNDAKKAY